MEFIDKLKKTKGMGWMLIGLAAGVALIVIGGMSNGSSAPPPPDTNVRENELTPEAVRELEQRVAYLISRIDGASNVSVLITMESGSEYVYQGGNRVRIVTPTIRGVAVICTGGDNPVIQQKIINMLSALFNLPTNRIFVSG